MHGSSARVLRMSIQFPDSHGIWGLAVRVVDLGVMLLSLDYLEDAPLLLIQEERGSDAV